MHHHRSNAITRAGKNPLVPGKNTEQVDCTLKVVHSGKSTEVVHDRVYMDAAEMKCQQQRSICSFIPDAEISSTANSLPSCSYCPISRDLASSEAILSSPHSALSFPPFYRAMHYSAKCGIAIACRPSVCPSVQGLPNFGGIPYYLRNG